MIPLTILWKNASGNFLLLVAWLFVWICLALNLSQWIWPIVWLLPCVALGTAGACRIAGRVIQKGTWREITSFLGIMIAQLIIGCAVAAMIMVEVLPPGMD